MFYGKVEVFNDGQFTVVYIYPISSLFLSKDFLVVPKCQLAAVRGG